MKKQREKRKNSLRALVISAHPDDVDFGCAGTLAKWAREGAEIVYTICTSGEKGSDDPSVTQPELMRIREKEQIAAAAVIGAKEVIFLRKPDGELQYSLEFRGELVRVIRQCRPDILFTHDPANRAFDNQYLFHADHRVTGELVFDAAYPAALNRNFFPAHLIEGFHPHAVSTLDLKIKALRCHASQIQEPKIMEKFIRTWFGAWGREKGLVYAERFRCLQIFRDPGQRLRQMKKSMR